LIGYIRSAGKFRWQISKHFPDTAMCLVVKILPRLGPTATSFVPIAIIATLLCVANLVGWFPGEPTDDSNSQYAQAVARHFNDWHPPIMAWLWSGFRLLADGDGPMFSFHITCYWLSFGLIAVALGRDGRPLAAWGILGVGAFPPFLMMNVVILKDVGMAVTFLAAFAALFWYRIQKRNIPLAVGAISFVLLFYGTLVRTNAVFVVVPLLAYMINPGWLGRPWRLLAFSIPVAMALVPVSGLFNHSVLNATRVGIIRSLEIFDITGVAFYSDDLSVFGTGNSITKREVDDCYTSIEWDTLSPWGKCRFFWDRLAVSQDLQGVEKLDPSAAMDAQPNPDLLDRWVASIIRHPFAYAKHRLANFSSEIVPSRPRNAPAPAMERKPPLLMLYDVVTTPALWLAIGAYLLVLLASVKSSRRSAPIEAALALVLSGLPYSCAYLIIGVGTDTRYQFWSMVAIFTAFVISLSELSVPLVSLTTRSEPEPFTCEPIEKAKPLAPQLCE
jgi:hypothetical protein